MDQTYYTPPDQRKSLNYQKKDVHHLFQVIRAGESCSMVGIGSVGKSNILGFLGKAEAKDHYLQSEGQYCITVLLNPHMLIHLQGAALASAGAVWAGYELMLNRVYRELADMDHPDFCQPRGENKTSLIDEARTQYNHLFSNSRPLYIQAGIRHLESVIHDVLTCGRGWKIVFLFDEFEQFVQHLPAQFFQSLRGLRDAHKQRVLFITTSRQSLPQIVDELAPERGGDQYLAMMEGFVELFSEQGHYIAPLDYQSTSDAIDRYILRYRLEKLRDEPVVLDNLIRALYKVTGGHAGLLRRGFRQGMANRYTLGDASHDQYAQNRDVLNIFLDDSGVKRECATIFHSLPHKERDVLLRIANGQAVVDMTCLNSLSRKHIVKRDATDTPFVQLPLLRHYIIRFCEYPSAENGAG